MFQIQANELDFGLTPTVLGSGTFGVVHLAKYRGDVVAVKIPKLGFDDFQKEKDILLSLRHRNIVLCQGEVHLPNGQQGIVLEYMAQGTLKDYIEKYNPLTDETKISLSLGIAKGLAFLHGEEIFHRDLSHNNVLIDDVGTAKITDFGKARPISNVLGTSGTIGTYLWMPPEAFNNAYCKASDIFSFGILMWEMETGSTNPGPQNQDGQNVVDVINWRKSGGIPKIREGILSELIKACLKLDPQQRPGAVDIVNYLTTFQMRIR
uniref:Protein kinase domain-containing protein n=1 Tax=Arcella intermedia TaxID=1963864 RepID=A0A6B2LDI6_9EUKA